MTTTTMTTTMMTMMMTKESPDTGMAIRIMNTVDLPGRNKKRLEWNFQPLSKAIDVKEGGTEKGRPLLRLLM
jgi:cytochrome c oxidase assembly protein Cox11